VSSKNASIMGGSGGAMTIIPDVVLKGNDLYLSFTRTQERNNRTMSYYIDIIDMITISKAKIELASGGGRAAMEWR
jgi:hypothetical protein